MLPRWSERSEIVANLLNPAFCGWVIHSFIDGFNSESKGAMPFSLTFFALPFVLVKRFRDLIPKQARKTLHAWFDEHPSLKIGIQDRIVGYKEFCRESIIFLAACGAITIQEDGTIVCNKINFKVQTNEDASEVSECIKRANTLGKIFAKSGADYTIFSIIGVKP
jgi:hypothetical protein